MKKKSLLLLAVLLASFASCNGNNRPGGENSSEEDKVFHHVSFVNYDGTVLYEEDVAEGKCANYLGATPQKASTSNKYYFEFASWDKPLENILEDTIINPVYDMLDVNYSSDTEASYRSIFEVSNGKLVTIGYEYYQFIDTTVEGEVNVPSTYNDLPILRLGEGAFMDCKVSSVVLPESIRVIGAYAFNSCEYLSSLELPDAVNTIHHAAFYDTRLISSLDLKNVTFIGEDNFFLCNSLEEFKVNKNNTSFGVKEGMLFNKSYNYLYRAPDHIGKVNIPSSVKKMNVGALSRLNAVKEIVIPSTIKELPDEVFFESKMEKVTLKGDYNLIPNRAFMRCNQLVTVEISAPITKIGDYAFYSCEALENIKLNDNIVSLGEFSFAYCHSLREFYIPSKLAEIGYGSFDEQSGLEKFVCGKNQQTFAVKDGSLYSKDFKKIIRVPEQTMSITLDEGLEVIGDAAFSNCRNLTEITLPSSLTKIEEFAFHFCNSVSEMAIPSTVTFIGESAFYAMEQMTSIQLPEGITSIAKDLFYSCDVLTEVNIPSTVTEIGSEAFYKCSSLPSLFIPKSVTSFGKDTFGACDALDDIYYEGSEEEWNKIANRKDAALTDLTTIHFNQTK